VISIALPQEFAGSKRQQSRSMGEVVGTATPREARVSARSIFLERSTDRSSFQFRAMLLDLLSRDPHRRKKAHPDCELIFARDQVALQSCRRTERVSLPLPPDDSIRHQLLAPRASLCTLADADARWTVRYNYLECMGRCNRAGARSMSFSQSKDERLLAFYENVRGQVEIDKRSGGRYRFAGDGVKQYAEKLREEIERRRLRFTPIDWNE
jgi:hypothetical protein